MTTRKRTALVTGGNRGLGLGTCEALARAGLRVVLAARTEARAEAAAAGLRRLGLDVVACELDVTRPADIERIAAWAEAEHGGIDVLVNNAGVSLDGDRGGHSVDDLRPEVLTQTFAVNVHGPALLCRALAPGMKQRSYGRVVNVSSGLGQLGNMGGGWPAYRMSKAALNALTRVVAVEARGANVLVNAVCPGWVRTDMGGESAPRSIAEGVDGITWAALLPDDGPTGQFFRDRKAIPW